MTSVRRPTIITRVTSQLQAKEQKPKPKFWDGREQICDYIYRDVNGKEVFRKRRFALDKEIWGRDKSFQVLTPMAYPPNCVALGGPEDIADWLYRLPEITGAIEDGETIHWCEGEKDADALGDCDITATTNAMGAALAATDAQANRLVGASDIVIWMDKDGAVGAWNAVTRYNALIRVGFAPDQLKIVKAAHVNDKDAADHVQRYLVNYGHLGRPPIRVSTAKAVELAKGYSPRNAWKLGY